MAQDASKIHVGAARIFVSATAPATGNPPTLTPHTDGVPSAGAPVEVGHTTGVTTATYTPTKVDIDSEQAFGVVDTYVSTEMVEATFTIQERNFAALKLAFDAIGNLDDGSKTLFYAGGVFTVTSQCIVLTSRLRNAPTKFEVLTIYKAQSMEPVPIGYSRLERSTIAVRVRGVHDTTRNTGDQLFQWYREK
jgi:hypothetical protein